jgi:hypothetical protein
MDESRKTQNRRYRRSNVLLKATLEVSGGSLPVLLRNLSQDGALVQCEELPEPGTRVLFHRQGLSVPSRVAWAHCEHVGLQFDFPLFPRELLRHVPASQPRLPQTAMKRRPGFSSKPLTSAERALIESWATEGARKLGE